MPTNRPSAFKEAVTSSKASAPRVQEIKRVSYGIPKAENADPNLATLQAVNGNKKAADLFNALTGTVGVINSSVKSQEEIMQDYNARLIEKQKMDPERWGRVGDASNLLFQHNPIAVKLYNRDAGRDLATRTGMSKLSELMDSKDATELSTEDFISKWKEETIKAAASLGLDTSNETQLLAFSTALDPIGIKGAAQHQRRVSEEMKQQQSLKASASLFGSMSNAEPGTEQDTLIAGINEMQAALGVKATARMLPDVLNKLLKSGAADDVVTTVGNYKIDGVDVFSRAHITPKEAIWLATSSRQKMGDDVIEGWKVNFGGLVLALGQLPIDSDIAELDARAEQLLSTLPPSMANQRADYTNRYNHAKAQWQQRRLASNAKQLQETESKRIADANVRDLSNDPYSEIRRGDHVTEYTNPDGTPIIANGDRATASAGASSVNEMLQRFFEEPTQSNFSNAVKTSGNIIQGLRINGMAKDVNELIVSPMVKRFDARLNSPDVQMQIQKGNIPPDLLNTFKFFDGMDNEHPAMLEKDIAGPLKSIRQYRDTFGVNTEEAIKAFARSRAVGAAGADKKGKPIDFSKEVKAEFSDAPDVDLPQMTSALEIAVRSGTPLKDAIAAMKTQRESPQFFDWGFTKSKIPRSVFGDKLSRIPMLEEYVQSALGEELQRWNPHSTTDISNANVFFDRNKGAFQVIHGRQSLEISPNELKRRIEDMEKKRIGYRSFIDKVANKAAEMYSSGAGPSGVGGIASGRVKTTKFQ